jgi:hypothetical protein
MAYAGKYGQMATFPVPLQHRPRGPRNGLTGHLNAGNTHWEAGCGEGLVGHAGRPYTPSDGLAISTHDRGAKNASQGKIGLLRERFTLEPETPRGSLIWLASGVTLLLFNESFPKLF